MLRVQDRLVTTLLFALTVALVGPTKLIVDPLDLLRALNESVADVDRLACVGVHDAGCPLGGVASVEDPDVTFSSWGELIDVEALE